MQCSKLLYEVLATIIGQEKETKAARPFNSCCRVHFAAPTMPPDVGCAERAGSAARFWWHWGQDTILKHYQRVVHQQQQLHCIVGNKTLHLTTLSLFSRAFSQEGISWSALNWPSFQVFAFINITTRIYQLISIYVCFHVFKYLEKTCTGLITIADLADTNSQFHMLFCMKDYNNLVTN